MRRAAYFSAAAQKLNSMISKPTVGLPRALLYFNYHAFADAFFRELGVKTLTSPQTNKRLLDDGVRLCVDDACLPVKVYHGHVGWLRGRCDTILMPRFLSMGKGQSLCPYFCGLPDIVRSSMRALPRLIETPVVSLDERSLGLWCRRVGACLGLGRKAADNAYRAALRAQQSTQRGICDADTGCRVALIGHPYLIHDAFVNMRLIDKLRAHNIGVVTSESVSRAEIAREAARLCKPPFWYAARGCFGAAAALLRRGLADGVIYLSSFSCGVDSVFSELVRQEAGDTAFMLLKLDEHTGEAAIDTRIDAFADMLKRRRRYGCHDTADGQHMPCRQGVL